MVVYKLFCADNTKLTRDLQSLFQFYSGNQKIFCAYPPLPGKCYGKQQSQTNGGHVYMKVLDRIALALVIIGALNWGAGGCSASTAWQRCSAARPPHQPRRLRPGGACRSVVHHHSVPRCARRGVRITKRPPKGGLFRVFGSQDPFLPLAPHNASVPSTLSPLTVKIPRRCSAAELAKEQKTRRTARQRGRPAQPPFRMLQIGRSYR